MEGIHVVGVTTTTFGNDNFPSHELPTTNPAANNNFPQVACHAELAGAS